MERVLSGQSPVSKREEAAKGRLLHSMAIFLMVGGASFAIVTLAAWQWGQGSVLDALGALGLALLGLVIWLLNRYRRRRIAGLLLCALLLLVPTYYVLLEGPKSTATLLLAGGVIYADFLLGGRNGLRATALGCLLYLGAGWVYTYRPDWLTAASYTSPFVSDVVTVVAVSLALALTAGHFTRELKGALWSVREQEQVLRQAAAEKERLLAEVGAREERQRLLLQRVHELGGPIIPLSAGVIAMPIIGAVDERRAADVTRALLEGVEEQHARFAIIDVTGVSAVDARLGAALLQMVQGVRLLGAEPVLTGLSPAAAGDLMDLGLDFSAVKARATLQEGLDYALRQER